MPLPPEQTVAVTVDNEEPTLHFTQTIGGTQRVVLRDRSGQVLDLSEIAEITLFVKEQAADSTYVGEIECEIPEDGSDGEVEVVVDEDVLTYAGIHLGVFELKDEEDKTVALVSCFLNVEPDLRVANDPEPLTISEVRAAVLDRCAAENDLLGAQEFSDTLIAKSILAAVRCWNETPPSETTYTQITFPYHTQLLDGVLWKLYESKALNLERNRLRLTAGGVDHDDKDRVGTYRQAASAYAQTFKSWVVERKSVQAIGGFWGTESNPYFG